MIRNKAESRSTARWALFIGAALLAWIPAGARPPEKIHTLSLQDALQLAAKQNPDILYVRLEAEHAAYDVDVARDPFSLRLTARSDAVYTYGYPNNVNGHSPSILSAQLDRTIFDRVRHYQVEATREGAKSFALGSESQMEAAMYRIALLFLEVKNDEKAGELTRTQVAALDQLAAQASARVSEGAALQVDYKQVQVDLTEARQRMESLGDDSISAQRLLGLALGFPAGDRVVPAQPQTEVQLPGALSENDALKQALAGHKELQRLKTSLLAKRIELRSYKATRLPQANLVAQYSLIQKNTYENYFPQGRVQRNNGEIGADFILPILVGPAAGGHSAQAETDAIALQLQIYKTQNQITAAIHRSYQQLHKSEDMLAVLRQRLDLANSELTVTDAQQNEGHSSHADVERATMRRNEGELMLRQGEIDIEKARLEILHQLGNLPEVLGQVSGGSASTESLH